MAGSGEHTNTELQYLLANDNSGPLAHWLLSELMLRSDQDRAAGVIAARGRTKLTAEEFRADCEQILAKRLHELLPVARRIDGLNDEERLALADLLSVDPKLLDDVSIVASKAPPDDTPNALLDVLEMLWANQWRQLIERRLSMIALKASAAKR